MIGTVIRRAAADDVDALVAYLAAANAEPKRQCLHTPAGRPRVLREALLQGGGLVEGSRSIFFVATGVASRAAAGISGALGIQSDTTSTIGWLLGPWISSLNGWKVQAPALLEELLQAVPPNVRRLDAFLHVDNCAGLGFLQQHGFTIRPPTHIYVAAAGAGMLSIDLPLLELGTRHEVGFRNLHRETFPAADSTSAEELLAGRDEEHVIFAAVDDLRLLGYVCVSVNAAPREGFIDYLAVRPAARGRGIGRRLLQVALRWSLENRRLPQVALCVTEWRDDARRLYERAGFRLSATGRGARRQVS